MSTMDMHTRVKSFLRRVTFLGQWTALVLCCYKALTTVAATWTDVADGKNPYQSVAMPVDWHSGSFPTWRSCAHACNASACALFVWDAGNERCKLGPAVGLTYGVLTQGDHGYRIGQIDENGELVWLGIGREPTLVHWTFPSVGTRENCREACDMAPFVVLCLTASVRSTDCQMGSGYMDDEAVMANENYAESGIKTQLLAADPTGFGTRIAPSKFAPAPPVMAVVPYVLLNTGLPKVAGAIDNTPLSVESVTDCAVLCHNDEACHSFNFVVTGNLGGGFCKHFDYVVKGVIQGGVYGYGIIDRSGPAGNIQSLIPCTSDPTAAELGKFFVADKAACARKCYEYHEPFLCTIFRFYDAYGECLLFAMDLFYETDSIAFDPPASGYTFGRITDGRRAFHQPTDNGNPSNQMNTTTKTTTTGTTEESTGEKLKVKTYRFNPNADRNGTTPREIYKLPTGPDDIGNRAVSLCTLRCFSQSDWCRGVVVDMVENVCRLYDTPVGGGSDQMVVEAGNSYGE